MLDGAIIILFLLSRSHTFHWMRWFWDRWMQVGWLVGPIVEQKLHRCCDMQARNSNMTSRGMSMKRRKGIDCVLCLSEMCNSNFDIYTLVAFLSISRAFCFSISRISWGLVLPEKRVLSPSTLSLFCVSLVFVASTPASLHPNDIKMKHHTRIPDKLHSSSFLVKRNKLQPRASRVSLTSRAI